MGYTPPVTLITNFSTVYSRKWQPCPCFKSLLWPPVITTTYCAMHFPQKVSKFWEEVELTWQKVDWEMGCVIVCYTTGPSKPCFCSFLPPFEFRSSLWLGFIHWRESSQAAAYKFQGFVWAQFLRRQDAKADTWVAWPLLAWGRWNNQVCPTQIPHNPQDWGSKERGNEGNLLR